MGSLGHPFEAGLSSFMVATGQIDWLEFELEEKLSTAGNATKIYLCGAISELYISGLKYRAPHCAKNHLCGRDEGSLGLLLLPLFVYLLPFPFAFTW